MPNDEKLTVTGLPRTDMTPEVKALSLITGVPGVDPDEVTAEMCICPPVFWTVTSTDLFWFIPAILARVICVAISDVARRNCDFACHCK